MNEKRRKRILISEQEHGLPYSKGLTASSLTLTGLGPVQSYAVANAVERELVARGKQKVSEDELQEITLEVLRREAGEEYANAFLKWQSVADLDVPLIVLLGGATGVGKSTIATQLATRLGITRVISTDAVREVLRSAFTREMFPTLYASSFQADQAVRQPIPHSGDRLIIGFREQAATVAVGTQALIDRAIAEGTDLIVEGTHLVPGFLEGVETDRAVVVSLLVVVEDEDLHRSHFYWRPRESRMRPSERYLSNFHAIRRIQKYMMSSARMRGVPIISHVDLDVTLADVIDHVIGKALATARESDELREDVLEEVVRGAITADKSPDEGSHGKQGGKEKGAALK